MGLSLAKAAGSIGVSKRQFMRYEAGQSEVSFKIAARLCEVLQVDTAWLLTGRKPPVEEIQPITLRTIIGGVGVVVEFSPAGISIHPQANASIRTVADKRGIMLTVQRD